MKVKATETITLEGVTYNIKDLPDHIQHKVQIYDEWKQDAEKLRSELIKCDSAMRDFGFQIARDIQVMNGGQQQQEQIPHDVEPARLSEPT